MGVLLALALAAAAATPSSAPPAGYSDVGPGFCTANGKRLQTFMCDTTGGKPGCPPATPSGCAAVCGATKSCAGFMIQTMETDPSTCNLVSATEPSGSGTWVEGQTGNGLEITSHDGEARDHCYKRAGGPAPAPGPAGPAGYTDVGSGFCTDGAGKRPQTQLCDTDACSFTPQSCAALCTADTHCAGFMTQNQSMYQEPLTCQLVTPTAPSGGGHWSVQQPGNGFVVQAHDSETRDHCWKKSGAPAPPAPPGPSPPPTPPPPTPPTPPAPPAAGTVSVTVDARSSGKPFTHVWKRSFGSGHAAVGLRDDWQSALKRATAELGLRGVRQHGLLDDDIGVVVGH